MAFRGGRGGGRGGRAAAAHAVRAAEAAFTQERPRHLTDCYYFLNATCRNEATCEFRHSKPCRAVKSRGTATVCKAWVADQCRDAECEGLHPTVKERERIPCRFYQLGTCTKEELCPFAHIDAATAPVPAQPKEPAVAPVEPRKQAVKPAPRAQSSGSSNRTAGSGSSKAAKPGSISIAELRKQRAWGSGSGKPGAISLSELRKQRQARQTGDRPRSAASSAAVDRTGGRLPADYRGPAGAKASARAVKRGRGASESSDSKRRDAAPSRSQKKQAAAPRSAAAAAGIVVTDEMKAARAAKFGKVATGGEGSAGGAAARAGAGRSQGGTGAGSGANEAPPKRPRVEVSASASSPATKEAQAPQPSPTVSEIGDDVLAEIEGAGDPLAGLADDDDDDDLDAELAMMEGQTTA